MTAPTTSNISNELDQESDQALMLDEAYALGYHKVKDGCLVPVLERLNAHIQQEKSALLNELLEHKHNVHRIQHCVPASVIENKLRDLNQGGEDE